MKEISIKDEFIKLDQLLKYIGLCNTGGESKLLIQEEQILVNEEIETRRGRKIRSGDKIQLVGSEEIFLII